MSPLARVVMTQAVLVETVGHVAGVVERLLATGREQEAERLSHELLVLAGRWRRLLDETVSEYQKPTLRVVKGE